MKEKKAIKVHTLLIFAFIVPEILLIITQIFSYKSVAKAQHGMMSPKYLQSYNLFLFVELVICIALITTVCITISRSIRTSLASLNAAAREIAKGNVDVELKKKRNDEFGELVDSFQMVVDNIRYESQVAGQVAEGNLMIDVKPSSDNDALGAALKNMVEKNQTTLSHITDAAMQVSTSSSEVANASEALAQGSTEQASAIEEITASISDVAGKTKENAQEASNAAELVEHALDNVHRGNDQMSEMMNAMRDINDSSESISKIIKVIDDHCIPDQHPCFKCCSRGSKSRRSGKGICRCCGRSQKPCSKECYRSIRDRRTDRRFHPQSQCRFQDRIRDSQCFSRDHKRRRGERRHYPWHFRGIQLSGNGDRTDQSGDRSGIPGRTEQLCDQRGMCRSQH